MRYTRSFVFTHRETDSDVESVGHELALRAGLAYQVAAGFYDFLPLGTLVLRKIESIIREEMNKSGALEIKLPIMQPATLWHESGRWNVYGQEMFKLSSRNDRAFCLGPTHEELIVDLVRSQTPSYKDLPFTLYQIGTKFRDERRPRGGLLRAKEFYMKDAYSFDLDEAGLNRSYEAMRSTYLRILERAEVTAIPVPASTGEMGGSSSEEFMAPSPAGEDKFVITDEGVARKLDDDPASSVDSEVKTGIEICHIFKLGTRYTSAMNLLYMDADGSTKPVVMGCYGIGVSRMIPTIIEQHHDDKGIVWPKEIAPFDMVIVPIRYDLEEVMSVADAVYAQLVENGLDVLLDDRDVSAGTKFRDHDLLGIPYKLIVGPKSIKTNEVELERRFDGKTEKLDLQNIMENVVKRL